MRNKSESRLPNKGRAQGRARQGAAGGCGLQLARGSRQPCGCRGGRWVPSKTFLVLYGPLGSALASGSIIWMLCD